MLAAPDLASESQRPSCLCLPSSGITNAGHHAQLFTWVPRDSEASSVPTGSSIAPGLPLFLGTGSYVAQASLGTRDVLGNGLERVTVLFHL